MIQIGDTVHDVSGSVYYSMLSLARCATVPAGSYVCLLGLGNVACSLFMLLCDLLFQMYVAYFVISARVSYRIYK